MNVSVAFSLVCGCLLGFPGLLGARGLVPLSGSFSGLVPYRFQGSCKGHGKEGRCLETGPKGFGILVTSNPAP